MEEWETHLMEYRQHLENQRGKKEHDPDAIILSTFHSSKGLEFEEVFLVDINEGIIPHKKANMDADLEEERRLLYVGMTRARENLYIFAFKERNNTDYDISPFINEIKS